MDSFSEREASSVVFALFRLKKPFLVGAGWWETWCSAGAGEAFSFRSGDWAGELAAMVGEGEDGGC